MISHKAHIIALFNQGKLGLDAAEHYRRSGYALICQAGKVVDMVWEDMPEPCAVSCG